MGQVTVPPPQRPSPSADFRRPSAQDISKRSTDTVPSIMAPPLWRISCSNSATATTPLALTSKLPCQPALATPSTRDCDEDTENSSGIVNPVSEGQPSCHCNLAGKPATTTPAAPSHRRPDTCCTRTCSGSCTWADACCQSQPAGTRTISVIP